MALAIIELDNVLIDGIASSLWAEHMADIEWVDRDTFLEQEQRLMAGYLNGERTLDEYLALFLSPLVGRTADEVDFIAGPFVEDVIEPVLNNDALRGLAQHRAAGDRILLIGVIPQFLADAIGERLKIADTLGVALEEQHGFYTGRRLDNEGALQDWVNQEGESLANAHCYAHSSRQSALMESVAYAHAVNPDTTLQQHALENGWETLSWR